jgi:hypothetical protein
MKLLLAIISCHKHAAYRQAIRETWLPLVPDEVDAKFFCGAGSNPLPDEVFLDCPDSYDSLPSKVQQVTRWAQDYDFMLKIDNDVVLRPTAFLASGFERYDFVGRKTNHISSTPYGFCYTLSKKAMGLIAAAPLPQGNNDEHWVAQTLGTHGIQLHSDDRYHLYTGKRGDFGPPKHRPLRAPRRDAPYDPTMPELVSKGTFAYCMYLQKGLAGEDFTDEQNIVVMNRIFKETQ